MTDIQAENAASRLEKIKEAFEKDRDYSLVAYILEMAQIEISLVLASRDNQQLQRRHG